MTYTKQDLEKAIDILNAPSRHINITHMSQDNNKEHVLYSSDLVRAFEIAIEVMEERNKDLTK